MYLLFIAIPTYDFAYKDLSSLQILVTVKSRDGEQKEKFTYYCYSTKRTSQQ